MLTYCQIKNKKEFFTKVWCKMTDDIEKDVAQKYYPANYTPSETEIQDILLEELEDILTKNGQQITNFNLPQRSISHEVDITNRLIQEEMNYDTHYLKEEANKSYLQLNTDQKQAFHQIVDSILNNNPQFYFVSGHGETGKTFLWNSIVSYLRAKKNSTNCCIIRSCFFITSKWTHNSFKISYTYRYRRTINV